MDPQATWNKLLDAWKTYDWQQVQEAADDLKRWMAKGGFPPDAFPQLNMGSLWNRAIVRAACEFAWRTAWQVLQSPNGIPQGVPFSVSCFDCDIDSPPTYQAAADSGWIGIEFRPDLPLENFLGYCPDHVPEPPWKSSAEVIAETERRS